MSSLDCDLQQKVDFIQQLAMTSSVAGLRRGTSQSQIRKHFPKPNLHQKKVIIIVWWSTALLIHYNFLNLGNTITSENYAHQINAPKTAMPAACIGNRKGPILLHDAQLQVVQSMLQKLNKLGYKLLPHQPHSPDLLPMTITS